jgi:hypothetical protein
MDQTGVHLVPASNWTYESVGSSSVAVVGAEDKRQITVCIASSLIGSLLPPQIIFQGKTPRCLPPSDSLSMLEAKASNAHVTFSENHWSNQATMKEYIEKIVVPYADKCIKDHHLAADANIILMLDVWAVHKSEEFRGFLRSKHPRIHLVFVPANCTSKLQVADVALQRPFKHGITTRFDEWVATVVAEQIANGDEEMRGLTNSLKMATMKPLAMKWCIESWKELREKPHIILAGWRKCCVDLYDVNSPMKRRAAMNEVLDNKLEMKYLPEEKEQDAEEEDDEELDDELDLTKLRIFGIQSTRVRTQSKSYGYQLDSSHIQMTDDSERE